jgi:hypothetical protein
LEGSVWCFLNLVLRWADLWPIDGDLVVCRCGWIFVASTTIFFVSLSLSLSLFVVMVAAGGVGVMVKD